MQSNGPTGFEVLRPFVVERCIADFQVDGL
jgi:hypothetical protein